jgi:hypothetical protein
MCMWSFLFSPSSFQHTFITFLHYEKKGCFVISLATQFLSCNDHLQLTIFLHCECYWTSMSCKVATHRIYNKTHYNSIAILSKPFIFNYYATPLQLQP